MDSFDDNEDYEVNEAEHNRLISAVSKLDKTQHIKAPTRSEPTNPNSEFNLIKSDNKLDINDVIKVLENTAGHVLISKNIKKTQNAANVLQKPLEKPQAERIKRSTGYKATKEKVGRWDPVVARSRTLDYVSYPIKHVSHKRQSTQEFLSKLKSKSPLEIELDEIDPPALEPEENDDGDEQLYPMTYQEMLEHKQSLAKLRAQQSFKAAKAKRQSKIKSKKYHRILKKERMKQQLKEFEDLQKTDPEEALKRLEEIEKARALERHTLRHKNTGKWAKSKLVRAKYDKEVRQELSEQLAVSRSLTKKVQNNESSDDDEETEETIPDLTLVPDPQNPWMMKKSNTNNIGEGFDFRHKKPKAILDEALLETASKTLIDLPQKELNPSILTSSISEETMPSETNIDPNKFISSKPKFLNSIVPEGETGFDELDDELDTRKVNIEDVFEDDDVVASFRQEKDEEANKDQPKDIDLSLPGWGSWGGKGVKAPKRKRNRFIVKAPPKMLRRDENKGDIIIKEYKDPKLSAHKITEVPFPFTSVKEYEAAVRAPIGNTFVPEKAHKLLIRPSVITKAGAIIEPMDQEELLIKKNRIYKKKNALKLLAK